jgi:hypothetical protein
LRHVMAARRLVIHEASQVRLSAISSVLPCAGA